jgi:hypothetical protein
MATARRLGTGGGAFQTDETSKTVQLLKKDSASWSFYQNPSIQKYLPLLDRLITPHVSTVK